jgi:hypothetical protein
MLLLLTTFAVLIIYLRVSRPYFIMHHLTYLPFFRGLEFGKHQILFLCVESSG